MCNVLERQREANIHLPTTSLLNASIPEESHASSEQHSCRTLATCGMMAMRSQHHLESITMG